MAYMGDSGVIGFDMALSWATLVGRFGWTFRPFLDWLSPEDTPCSVVEMTDRRL